MRTDTSPAPPPSKWVVLFLSFLTLFGPFYCYDNPAANLNQLKTAFSVPLQMSNMTTPDEARRLEIFNVNYGLLYSLVSFPNIVLPLVGGLAMDIYGIPTVLALTAALCLVGQAVFTAGAWMTEWGLMLLGRSLYGIGAETLYVTQTTVLAMWFDETNISVALSVLVVSTKMSSVANSLIGPVTSSASEAFVIGLALAGLSCAAALALARIQQRFAAPKSKTFSPSSKRGQSRRGTYIELGFTNDMKSSLLREESNTVTGGSDGGGMVVSPVQPRGPPSPPQPSMFWHELRRMARDVRGLSVSFWLVCVVCCFGFTSVSSLSNVAPAYLTHANALQGHKPQSTEIINLQFASMNLTMMLLSPLAGRLVDAFKHYFGTMFGGMALAAGVYVYAALTGASAAPLALLVVTSAGLAVFSAAIWPAVPLLVPPRSQGTAYGIFVSVQNLGLSVGAAVVSALQPPRCDATYKCCLLVLAGFAAAAAISSLVARVVWASSARLSPEAGSAASSVDAAAAAGGGASKRERSITALLMRELSSIDDDDDDDDDGQQGTTPLLGRQTSFLTAEVVLLTDH